MSRAGAHFGHYRLDRLIGSGGMGQVWLAFDTVIERDVALKLLRPDLFADEDYRRQFEREARIAAALREPHVIAVHGFGVIDDRLYIDMALIDGTDAGSVLRQQGPMTPARAVDVVEQVAAALDAAHRAGLLHRDVKPSNLLVHDSGFVYLIDFGISRRGEQHAIGTSTPSEGRTLGTLAYMAPERLAGTDGVSGDVFSLACVLYELLTGVRAISGTTRDELLDALVNDPPPVPSQSRPGVPAEFDRVIARGMAKDPDLRYKSARDLAIAARAALGTRSVGGPKTSTDLKPALASPELDTPFLASPLDVPDTTVAVTLGSPRSPARRRLLWISLATIAVTVGVTALVFALRPTSPDDVDDAITATIEIAEGLASLAVDPALHRVFVSNTADDSVSVIDAASHEVISNVATGESPAGLAFDPRTKSILVANTGDGTVSVIDMTTWLTTATVTVGGSPQCVAVDPSSNAAYVTNSTDDTVSVIDTTDNTVTTTIAVGPSPQCLAIDETANAAYVANSGDGTVSVINTADKIVTTTIPVDRTPQSIAVEDVAFTVFVTGFESNTVSMIDTRTNKHVSTLDVGKAPRGVAIDEEARVAYVANFADGSVSVIDTRTVTVTRTIALGGAPTAVAVDSTTHTAFVVVDGSVVVLA